MTSEVKTEARFGLSVPDYLLGPVFEAAIGLVKIVLDPKSKCPKKWGKKTDICPVRPAGSAAGKKTLHAFKLPLVGSRDSEFPLALRPPPRLLLAICSLQKIFGFLDLEFFL